MCKERIPVGKASPATGRRCRRAKRVGEPTRCLGDAAQAVATQAEAEPGNAAVTFRGRHTRKKSFFGSNRIKLPLSSLILHFTYIAPMPSRRHRLRTSVLHPPYVNNPGYGPRLAGRDGCPKLGEAVRSEQLEVRPRTLELHETVGRFGGVEGRHPDARDPVSQPVITASGRIANADK